MTTSNTDEKLITKKDLLHSACNIGALGMEYSWNYPRQMHLAFCLMINPMLKKIYADDPEGYAEALTRHVAFFNITPQLAPFVGGIAVSMEERVAKGELEGAAVDSVKAALMGPLSGIGDSIFLGCIRVIAVAVGISLASTGNIMGPIAYFLIYNIPAFLVRFIGAVKGYELGFSFLANAEKSGLMEKVMFASGEDVQTVQTILDGIMPGMLGLSATWIYYWLLKKKVNPMWLILGTMILGVVGVYFGFLG